MHIEVEQKWLDLEPVLSVGKWSGQNRRTIVIRSCINIQYTTSAAVFCQKISDGFPFRSFVLHSISLPLYY
ncbi:uncharacterized protein Dmul_23880 [Desulfococcus multivorans]|nr:uncharacterized protein Dmul_23880 [Desulfococcus multivorans]